MSEVIPYTPLCELAEKYGTDKRPEPLGHGYTHYYDMLFASQRESVRKVVEIGIDTGASLRMWRDYFPNAAIYGLDVDPNKLFSEDRIECLLCEQGSTGSLFDVSVRIGGGVNFILDDGSHRPDHQVTSAIALMPLLAPGGIYIIEDVLDPWKVTTQLPFSCEVESFRIERDPYSKLVVIRAN